jgi:hypothetical protein
MERFTFVERQAAHQQQRDQQRDQYANTEHLVDRIAKPSLSHKVTVTLTRLKKGEPDSLLKITPEPPAPKPEEVNPKT